MPWSATNERLLPSISKGLVTTATVRMPSSRATCATTGAAPVPVPPPIPAVMNSMSQPSTSSTMRSRSSIAAWRPTSGSAPAPSPLVMLQPICSAVLTLACLSAWLSVLMHMNSTPSMPHATMCATALPPPPPTPITLMMALWLYASISSNMFSLLYTNTSGWLNSRSLALSASKVPLKPGAHAVEHRLRVPQGARATRGQSVVTGVEQQPHTGGIDRVAHHVGEAAHRLRQAQAHRNVEHFLGELDGAFHLGAAAGQHDAGSDHFLEAAAPQLLAHQPEELLVARLDDLGEGLARQAARRALAHARHL